MKKEVLEKIVNISSIVSVIVSIISLYIAILVRKDTAELSKFSDKPIYYTISLYKNENTKVSEVSDKYLSIDLSLVVDDFKVEKKNFLDVNYNSVFTKIKYYMVYDYNDKTFDYMSYSLDDKSTSKLRFEDKYQAIPVKLNYSFTPNKKYCYILIYTETTSEKNLDLIFFRYNDNDDTFSLDNIIDGTKVKKVVYIKASDSLKLPLKVGYYFKNLNKYEHYKLNEKNTNWNLFMLNRLLVNKNKIKFKKNGKNTPAIILHSGGTSGIPKNVVLQNRAFILGAKQEETVLKKLNPGDSCLGIMPNFHGFGISVLMHTPLTLGCYTILVPQIDSKKFDILLKKTKPTCILGVPTLFEALTNSNNVKHLDLSFMKYIVSGGDILQKGLEDKINTYLKEHNANIEVTQGYGMTEALAAVTLAHDRINKSGSIGIPLPGNYIKIINPSTRETLPYNNIGEICIHSKALMLGYLNNEKETNEVLQMHEDGYVWLHTGDLGLMDEDGFIFYKGRIKRMIISSGYNIYPNHIEDIIESHPAVLQCTVVGMPHPYKKEVPKAYIVLKPGFHGLFIKTEIKEYCKKNLEYHMVPYKFVYRNNLPKTKLGKVDFKRLMEDNDIDDDEGE